jgi:hypothetical protein
MPKQAAVVAVMVLQFAAIFNFQARAADEASLADLPFMVHCKDSCGTDGAFYLGILTPSGVAVYISPDRKAGTITIRGRAQSVGGDGAGSCTGKTIQQLRETGQAFDLHQERVSPPLPR